MKWSVKAQVSQDWLLYKFHNYTDLTTIQVSQIHWTHRADYALVKLCLSWMPLSKACALCNWCLFHRCIGALPMKWNLSNFTGFPLCSNTDPGLFVKSRDYWISCRAAENKEFWGNQILVGFCLGHNFSAIYKVLAVLKSNKYNKAFLAHVL